jgi:hypothetical protein
MSLDSEQVNEALKFVFDYLDKINLSFYLEKFKYKTVREMMDKLNEDYPYNDIYSSYLFDVVAEDEFVSYLKKKYNLNIRETTVTYYYI